MNTNIVIGKFWLISTILLISGFFCLHAQENGYWKLENIETKNEEEIAGKLKRQVDGKAGDLLFTYDNGNNNSRLIVRGTWSQMPEILSPGEEVSVSANLNIEEFVPPKHHYSPINSLYFTSYYSSGSFEERKINAGYCNSKLTVSASTSDKASKNIPSATGSVTIKAPESPESLKGNLFIIRVKLGENHAYREYYYLYKWQAGEPPVISIESVQGAVWKLENIETKNEEEIAGKLKRQVDGKAGDLLFTYDNGNNNSRLIVRGTWSQMPEILSPGEEVSVSANLNIEEFVPPKHHYSPINSLYFTSYYSSGSFEERKINAGYCNSKLTVSASTSDKASKNIPSATGSVTIKAPESPESLKGNLFIIRVKLGENHAYREYFYIYKWQPGNLSPTK